MIAKVSQKSMHIVRWILAIGWLGLIGSLLLGNLTRIPFLEWAHSKGTSVFWGTIVPSAIAILLIFGHEGWRRVCPLGFLSQISQRLGLRAPKRIEENSWLGTYHLYIQCGLLFLGLALRLLWCNGSPVALGILCLVTIVAAILVGYRYGGRSWCHYFCPMSPVQTVIGGPRGLFSSAAHTAPPMSLTQSKCRIWDSEQGKEVSACVTCKSPCVDIDAEQTYWKELLKPGRQLLQYGYLGLVIGFFGYFLLYHGGWDYYYEGMFYSASEAGNLWSSGFFFADVPRVVAVPLTLAIAVLVTTSLGCYLERLYKGYLLRNAGNLDIPEAEIRERARHQVFCVFTAVAFNVFFAFGWRTLIEPDSVLHHGLTLAATLPSAWWLYRNFNRDRARYSLEGETMTLRRQIKKLPIDLSAHLGQRSIEDLRPEELDLLANVLPQISRGSALQLFTGLVEELADKGWSNPKENWAWLDRVQARLGIDDEDREQAIKVVGLTRPNLLRALTQNSDNDRTLRQRVQSSRRASRSGISQKSARSAVPAAGEPHDESADRSPQPTQGPVGEGARVAARLNRDFLTPPNPQPQQAPAAPQFYDSTELPTPSGPLAGAADRDPSRQNEVAQSVSGDYTEGRSETERETHPEETQLAGALRHLSKIDKDRSGPQEHWTGIDRALSRLGIDSHTREQVLKAVDRSRPNPSRSLPQSADSSRTLAYEAQPRRSSQSRSVRPAAAASKKLQARERQAPKSAGKPPHKAGAAGPSPAVPKLPSLPPISPLEDAEDPSGETLAGPAIDRASSRRADRQRSTRAIASRRSSEDDSKTVMRRVETSSVNATRAPGMLAGALGAGQTPDADTKVPDSEQSSDATANALDFEQTLEIVRPEI